MHSCPILESYRRNLRVHVHDAALDAFDAAHAEASGTITPLALALWFVTGPLSAALSALGEAEFAASCAAAKTKKKALPVCAEVRELAEQRAEDAWADEAPGSDREIAWRAVEDAASAAVEGLNAAGETAGQWIAHASALCARASAIAAEGAAYEEAGVKFAEAHEASRTAHSVVEKARVRLAPAQGLNPAKASDRAKVRVEGDLLAIAAVGHAHRTKSVASAALLDAEGARAVKLRDVLTAVPGR